MSQIGTAPTWRYTSTVWALPDRLAYQAMELAEGELRAFLARHLPRDGRPVSRRRARNLVTDEGARWLLRHAFPPPGQVPFATAAWFVMPKGAGSLVNGDTMASHAGWSEVTDYSQASRQSLVVPEPVSGRSLSNADATANFTASGTASVAGLALAGSSAKGGTSGTLYGGANFLSPQSVDAGKIFQIVAAVSF